MATSIPYSVRLIYTNDSFPGQEWNEFLKNCNATRNGSRHGSWLASIRGKGFIIWISAFCLSKDDQGITWHATIELSSSAPAIAWQTLEEFIAGALYTFEKMSLLGVHKHGN